MERGFYFKEELCDGFFSLIIQIQLIYAHLFLVMVFFSIFLKYLI
jgi:hypothetical protein